MIFDFTPQVKLSEEDAKRYTLARIALLLFFIGGGLYALYLLLFPSSFFAFNFNTPDSLKNTIAQPHMEHGNLIFDTAVTEGLFAQADIEVTLEKDSPNIQNASIRARHSYRAFLLPQGDSKNNALIKNTTLPFPSGTLLGSPDAVFVVDKEELRPFGDVQTFLALGYSFEDVVKTDSEKLSAYKKGRLFTIGSLHPDGTIFYETETDTFFVVRDGMLSPIERRSDFPHTPIAVEKESRDVTAQCQLKKSFSFFSPRYTCTLPLHQLQNFSGNDYQFHINSENGIPTIKTISVILKRAPTSDNAKRALSDIKKRAVQNFNNQKAL